MIFADISTKDEGDFHFVFARTPAGLSFVMEECPESGIGPEKSGVISVDDSTALYYAATHAGLTVQRS